MKLVRAVVFIISLILLGAGYAASQWAFFQGPEALADYSKSIDQPVVSTIALLLLVACLVLPFLGKSGAEQ